MTKNDPIAYSAVITISFPNLGEETNLRVKLLPADLIAFQDGSIKMLQDCTLSELQSYADTLEARLWQKFAQSTLVDLVVDDQAEVSISFPDGLENQTADTELWLAHAIVLEEPKPIDNSQDTDNVSMPKDPGVVEVSDDQGMPVITSQPDSSTEDEFQPDQELADVAPEESDAETQVQETEEATKQVYETKPPSAEISDETIIEEATEEGLAPDLSSQMVTELVEPIPLRKERLRILGLRRPHGHPTWTAVDIMINEPAFRDSQAHALSSLDREVAGILVGPPPEKQPDGRYIVHISDTIIAKHTRMHGASVTYTPESWRYVHDKLAEKYPDESAVIVGWYHTHPGFGIFMSGMDQFIHQNFFTQIWHIALVLDPLAQKSGFFCWDRQKTQVELYEFPWPKWASSSW